MAQWKAWILLAAGYLAAAVLIVLQSPAGAAPVWPSSGLALAALLLWGTRLWPGVALGAAPAAVAAGASWPAALLLALGAALEALLACALVRKHVGVPRRFRRVSHVIVFIAACAAAAAIGAAAAVLGALPSGIPGWSQALLRFWSAWQADLAGMLVFAPLVLSLSHWPKVTWPMSRRGEVSAYVAVLALLSAPLYGGLDLWFVSITYPFLLLPLIMWAAFRFGQRMVSATIAFATLLMLGNAAAGNGVFAEMPAHESQILLVVLVAVLSLTGLILSAVVRDRRDAMKELGQKRDQLEARVRERTLELAHANRALQSDIAARAQAERLLKESETRVRRMLDSIVDYAIAMLDPDGRITTWNSGAERIIGYRVEEVLGQHFSRFYVPEHSPGGRPPDRETAIASAEGRFSEEGWRVRKDGSRFWASMILTAIRDESGRLLGFTKILRDLTERRQYEANLMEAKATAEKANQAKSEFLARMSHELRTPLNSLLILARLLADNANGNLTPKQVRYAETIYGAGSDLLVLIDDILDLARVESGAVNSIVISPVDMNELRDFLEGNFKQLAREKGIDFSVRAEEGVPPVISTDGRRLQQILKNLLSNAFKFTSRGSVGLHISLESPGDGAHGAAGESGRRLAFSVTDTGIGIPEDKQQIIFEAFKQANDTTSRQYGGTGLGLAISREFARLLGGEIRVSSRAGKGSTFTVLLPLTPRPARAAEPAQPASELKPA